jgi:thiamine kinase-like enzyme
MPSSNLQTRDSIVAMVTQRYEQDQASERKAVHRSDIPIRYEWITPQWLTEVLCDRHPGCEVVDYRLGEPDNGTSARRRIYLEYNRFGQEAGLPASIFAKSSQELIHRISYALNNSARCEVNYYNLVRPHLSIQCPRAYFASYDPESFNSIVLLEDMEGYASFCDENLVISKEQALDMAVLLADLHAPFCDPKRFSTIANAFDTWPEHWAHILDNEMETYSNKGFLAAEAVVPPRLYARFEELWPRTMDSVAAQQNLPYTFNHGDTHFGNWFVTKNGRMGLSDWQGAVVGHWSRDVVYAFATAFPVENRRAWERELLEVYLDRLAAGGGPQVSFDDAWRWYRQQSLTALAYWTATLTPSPGMPADMQPPTRSLVFIERLSHAVDDLEALDSF